jgi:hypothetical protein
MTNGGNLDRLVSAGVIRDPDALSEAERNVIAGMSDQEVGLLIGMRQKLAAEHRKLASASNTDAELLESRVQSNFIL